MIISPKSSILDYDIIAKLLIVGDASVGKSSLVFRYTEDEFSDDQISTIGLDVKIKTEIVNGIVIKCQLCDTAGQDRFKSIVQSLYRRTHAILLVFDVTNEKSFKNIQTWYDDVKQGTCNKTKFLLIGNKCDNKKKRVVDFEKANEFAKSLGMSYIETSAKTDQNVKHCIFEVLQLLVASRTFCILNEPLSRVNIKPVTHINTIKNRVKDKHRRKDLCPFNFG